MFSAEENIFYNVDWNDFPNRLIFLPFAKLHLSYFNPPIYLYIYLSLYLHFTGSVRKTQDKLSMITEKFSA